MSRLCELSGKRVETGMKVSHSHIRTKRRFMPNLKRVRLLSETLGRAVSFRIAVSTLRSVDHREGLDNYLLKASDAELSIKARRLKAEIKKKKTAAPAALAAE
ncbi:50S ribosomal protein L28 [Iodidimonas nitroreducens]|uniref:Large ribosomal subunit protein bL28 n=1 Tax=Iodidimonas nitroreducens TaxID=1236968 RepID=A0A5A7NA92_9PROT|nr:50S ribosomal protein L28 [Iodidimonas nitroreducens]GAK34172.1 50S ribosomal protein L28 [alpha proteobacterium Q-1]GER05293.1 50S ribosomal protein L28 [Iodidimonas nitroreducens]